MTLQGTKYGWAVGDYAALRVEVIDGYERSGNDVTLRAGLVVRIVAITPKTQILDPRSSSFNEKYDDTKAYFYNAVPIGYVEYPRIRQDFVTLRKPTKKELVDALRKLDGIYRANKLVA